MQPRSKKPKVNPYKSKGKKPESLLIVLARLARGITLPAVEVPTVRLLNEDNSDAGPVEILGWADQVRHAVPKLILQLELWDDQLGKQNEDVLLRELVPLMGLRLVSTHESQFRLTAKSTFTAESGQQWFLDPGKAGNEIEVSRPGRRGWLMKSQDKMPFYVLTPPGWLAVMQEEERAVRLKGSLSNSKEELPEMAPARHSRDFRSVIWYGRDFSFTEMQAPIVEMLWSASENGTPDVGITSLLEAVGAASSRMSDLFRNNPAWGTLIIDGTTKGTKRLAPPPSA